jgi:hypothetical protein
MKRLLAAVSSLVWLVWREELEPVEEKWRAGLGWRRNGVPVGEVQRLCGDGAGFRGEVRLEWLREREDKWRLLPGEGSVWGRKIPAGGRGGLSGWFLVCGAARGR